MVFWEVPLETGWHEGAIHPVGVLFVLHYPTNRISHKTEIDFSLCDFRLPPYSR